ncbi:hypothetical protein [Sphingobium sp. B12D2B]|uniref:hypothetical protein n=1 Tax=Sphingobium sp. B12D2B TaxID=2940577 RepID=UPI0022256291|nr:hypothetical protein [Sphingobium sp. B12D2B]MCW2348578.1 hypothetical protein [Sphingobium sp. B12D2B]
MRSGNRTKRTYAGLLAGLLISPILAGASPATAQAPTSRSTESVKVSAVVAERIGSGPVIYPDMPGLEGDLGNNINGPSVIRVPSWIKNPLGKYYMYFGHHRGGYIRLAYADRPEGPWTVYKDGTLRLEQTSALHHISSPDAVVDEENKRIVLYYHGATEMPGGDYGGRPYAQRSFVATSPDGLSFTAASGAFGAPYIRVFSYKGNSYGLGMADKASAYPVWLRSGQFFRSASLLPPFEAGPRILDEMRHAGVTRIGDTLHVFYTNVGDSPERILHASVDLRPDWSEWTASTPTEVMRPEKAYEGANLPLVSSRGGMATGAEHALRDPGVLNDDGRIYLYYAVSGEKGIAVARVTFK